MRNGPHLFERLLLISWENNRDCYITMPLSLKTSEVQIKGDQWKKMFRTVQVYWGRNLVAIGPFWKGLILGDPGAVSRVWKRGRRKFSRTNERAPGMLLLTDQTHPNAFLWLGTKIQFDEAVSIALLSWSSYTKGFTVRRTCLARPGELSSRRVSVKMGSKKTKKIL